MNSIDGTTQEEDTQPVLLGDFQAKTKLCEHTESKGTVVLQLRPPLP